MHYYVPLDKLVTKTSLKCTRLDNPSSSPMHPLNYNLAFSTSFNFSLSPSNKGGGLHLGLGLGSGCNVVSMLGSGCRKCNCGTRRIKIEGEVEFRGKTSQE